MPSRIEDYALIGDCEAAALVARDASIDWLCWPRFDSDACFAALLGSTEHGRWKIAPTSQASVTRRYRGDSLVLETRFSAPEGEVSIVDFMPPKSASSAVIRMVIGLAGRMPMAMEFIPRFGYGQYGAWLNRLEDGSLRAISGPDLVTL